MRNDSSSKVGTAPTSGSCLDYNAGVTRAHTSKITASDRFDIYLRNPSDLMANGRLRVSCRGPSSWSGGPGGVFRLYSLSIVAPEIGSQTKHSRLSFVCLDPARRCELEVCPPGARPVPSDTPSCPLSA